MTISAEPESGRFASAPASAWFGHGGRWAQRRADVLPNRHPVPGDVRHPSPAEHLTGAPVDTGGASRRPDAAGRGVWRRVFRVVGSPSEAPGAEKSTVAVAESAGSAKTRWTAVTGSASWPPARLHRGQPWIRSPSVFSTRRPHRQRWEGAVVRVDARTSSPDAYNWVRRGAFPARACSEWPSCPGREATPGARIAPSLPRMNSGGSKRWI